MARWEKKADPFYKTGAWLRARALALARDRYICQECLRLVAMGKMIRPRTATMVHHIKPRKLYPELALDLNNLESLCNTCHERMTPERREKNIQNAPEKRRVIVIRNEVGEDDQR